MCGVLGAGEQLSQLCSVFRSQFPKLRFYLLALCYNCNYFGEELEGIWEEIFAYAKNRSLSMDSFALDIQLFVQFAFPEGYMSDPYSGVPVVSSIGLTTREKVLAGQVIHLLDFLFLIQEYVCVRVVENNVCGVCVFATYDLVFAFQYCHVYVSFE